MSKSEEAATDELHHSLRQLLDKVKTQVVILSRENRHKQKEIDAQKGKIAAFEKLTDSKIESERKCRLELKQLRQEFDSQSSKNSAIQAKLLNQISKLKSETQELEVQFRTDMANVSRNNDFEMAQLQRKYDSAVSESEELKREMKHIHKQTEDSKSNLDLQNTTMRHELESLRAEVSNKTEDIKHLKHTIATTNDESFEFKSELARMKVDREVISNRNTAAMNTIEQLKKYIQQLQSQSQIVNSAIEAMSDPTAPRVTPNASPMIQPVLLSTLEIPKQKHLSQPSQTTADETEQTATEEIDVSAAAIDLSRLKTLPQKFQEMQRRCVELQKQLLTEREASRQQMVALKSRVEENTPQLQTLKLRVTELEAMMNSLSRENEILAKEKEDLSVSIEKRKEAITANEIFLQMKADEENRKNTDLQNEINVLQGVICEKNTKVSDLEQKIGGLEDRIMDSQIESKRDRNQFEEKLVTLTQLSQEELQHYFKGTINELEDILNTTNDGDVQTTLKVNTDVDPSNDTTEESSPLRDTSMTDQHTTTQLSHSPPSVSSKKLIQQLLKSLDEEKLQRRSLESEIERLRHRRSVDHRRTFDIVMETDDVDELLNTSAAHNNSAIVDDDADIGIKTPAQSAPPPLTQPDDNNGDGVPNSKPTFSQTVSQHNTTSVRNRSQSFNKSHNTNVSPQQSHDLPLQSDHSKERLSSQQLDDMIANPNKWYINSDGDLVILDDDMLGMEPTPSTPAAVVVAPLQMDDNREERGMRQSSLIVEDTSTPTLPNRGLIGSFSSVVTDDNISTVDSAAATIGTSVMGGTAMSDDFIISHHNSVDIGAVIANLPNDNNSELTADHLKMLDSSSAFSDYKPFYDQCLPENKPNHTETTTAVDEGNKTIAGDEPAPPITDNSSDVKSPNVTDATPVNNELESSNHRKQPSSVLGFLKYF